ncbi:MAG: tannase/feruloyl esterase family alpha/beta hydrolase [Gammaproteobacteria bacterium]|nr:tannase/feruloyl esterase family alpha/beta hydrolase [Gammaproteobacteria bacterium]
MKLRQPDTTIALADFVPEGKFTPPDTNASVASLLTQAREAGQEPVAPPSDLPSAGLEVPAFCRVAGRIEPAIHFEVWMPARGWNGKFNGVGLGGYLGAINYNALAEALARGYAAASTDAGHRSSANATAWAIGNREAIVSLGHRAHHEMTVRAKALIDAHYGRAPRYSYFTGCSSGGWQGLTEAQRYPDDYDGIVAGAPALNVVHLHAGSIWNAFQARKVRPEKFALVAQAAIGACDLGDGVADWLIHDPPRCKFDPGTLQCPGVDDGQCLTAEEVEAFRNMYRGARNAAGGQVYPGWPASSERGLATWANPVFLAFVAGTFKDLAYQGDAGWDVEKFDFDADVAKADDLIGRHLNSSDPDLRAFRNRGGKLIVYHGWDDALVPATATIDYYRRVIEAVGGADVAALSRTREFARLYLGAGMGHCAGQPGRGPHVFDALAALETWVERQQAPDRIVASNPESGMKRPLCPWPQQARYTGTGSTDDDRNFRCVADSDPAGSSP